VALGHVLRLGGPPCSGKTSIARILAGRYDLRAYHADAHTWEHHDKAVDRRYPAAARTESLGSDELWLADVAAMAAAVEEIFAEVAAAGPRASDPQARSALRREDNLQVYCQVSTFFERRPEAGDPARSPVPFACECGASGCDAGVRLTLVEARRVFDARTSTWPRSATPARA
jgi:shikimate kinase